MFGTFNDFLYLECIGWGDVSDTIFKQIAEIRVFLKITFFFICCAGWGKFLIQFSKKMQNGNLF